jgi:hypothetical protein
MKLVIERIVKGRVYCPICTHTVDADVDVSRKKAIVVPGQRCTRCHATLDAGMVMQLREAA